MEIVLLISYKFYILKTINIHPHVGLPIDSLTSKLRKDWKYVFEVF